MYRGPPKAAKENLDDVFGAKPVNDVKVTVDPEIEAQKRRRAEEEAGKKEVSLSTHNKQHTHARSHAHTKHALKAIRPPLGSLRMA